ncbi:hypothetical protein GPA27_06120 [Aromatoleum toluolicum]|uniref:Uncharacterized protein n=1 Tax=Aromatoleum toluolicum TaxID=90060 RepID=A0ABX1NCH5_9RHOO|nr:hypothetical protein [Aromatoleum toluolicum]NMF96959.1 hypothetical protein [Aromatoleum toluolicum]
MYEALHIQDFGCIGHRTLPDGRVIINVPTAAMFDIDPEGAVMFGADRALEKREGPLPDPLQ